MKPLVLQSIEDDTGDRCVDIIRMPDGSYTFRECRRDPEDSHGWRYLSHGAPPLFPTEGGARTAARAAVNWLREQR